MKDLHERLVKFRQEMSEEDVALYEKLSDGQKPHTLFITSSDSRIDPHKITKSNPGELVILRNFGNMVPDFNTFTEEYGIMSAIEYAVLRLGVTNIIVCGHTGCEACAAIWDDSLVDLHTWKWLANMEPVRRVIEQESGEDLDNTRKIFLTERLNAIKQIYRLQEYPYVAEKLEAGAIKLEAWHYVVRTGHVYVYDEPMDAFKVVNP